MEPADLCGLLAEPDRLRVYAAVVLGAGTPDEASSATGLPVRDTERALRRLVRGRLVRGAGGRLTAEAGVFKEAVRARLPAVTHEPLDADPRRDAVLRAFMVNGRLVRLPAARGKRRIILEHVAAVFEPGVKYPEATVNGIMRAWYEDYAALRRYLVDEGLLARENGVYWRSGGYVDVLPGAGTGEPATVPGDDDARPGEPGTGPGEPATVPGDDGPRPGDGVH